MSAENSQANQAKSDIEQAVDNIKVDSLAENLKDSADNTNNNTDTDELQKPATLSDAEQTAFIDEELRTDK